MRWTTMVCGVLWAGCAKSADSAVAPLVSERRENGVVGQDVDLDGNGVPDIRNYYRERASSRGALMRKEVDLNRDGKADVISYVDANGDLAREEMDADWDGQLDLVDHYQKGIRVMTEYDSDHDGKPNVFKYFSRAADGTMYMERRERDEDGDGKIDVWERYGPDGTLIRTVRDTDGDGKVDVREE